MFFGITASIMCVFYVWKHKGGNKIFRYLVILFIPAYLFEAFYLHVRYRNSFTLMSWALLVILWTEKWYTRKQG